MANIPIETITKNNDGNTYIIKDANAIPKTGSNQISGDLIPTTDNTVNLGSISYNFRNINTKLLSSSSDLNIYSSFDGNTAGSFLTLKKIDSTSESGSFQLNAHTETQIAQLIGYPDGTLTWGGTVFTNGIKTYSIESRDTSNSSVLYLLGGSSYPNGAQINLYGNNHQNSGCFEIIAHGDSQILRGNSNGVLSWTGNVFCKTDDTGFLDIYGSSSYTHGAQLTLFGQDINDSYTPGIFRLMACRNNTTRFLEGLPNGTLIWNGQAVQTTSDQRLKQQISQIDDDLLTAWEDVNLVQFKYNDAVKEKGNTARLHTGYVVQQIDEACKSHGVDVSKYGLYCHEVYQEETREVEQADGTKTTEVIRPASEHYSLRYTEALIVECAYLRKKNKDLENSVLNLQTEIADLKSVIAELKTAVQEIARK